MSNDVASRQNVPESLFLNGADMLVLELRAGVKPLTFGHV